MPRVRSRRLAPLAALACTPHLLSAQEKSSPQRIADVIVQLNGGIHRLSVHACQGGVVTGTRRRLEGAR